LPREAALHGAGNRMFSALHSIGTYPFDLEGPIFAPYPAMKFGHVQSVNYFADLLAPMALQALADMPERDRGWVLTSPPLRGLPCGANLVCRALRGRLAEALPEGEAPLADPLEIHGPRTPLRTLGEFEAIHNYSKGDLEQRRQFHLPSAESTKYDLAGFGGRPVVFVNDINVTGTQLAAITKTLRNAAAKSLGVLLIVNVDPKIGRAFPRLEHEINTSRFAGLADYTAFLRDCEFEPTGKLISRLMSHDLPEFDAILEALPPAKRQMLHRAILREGFYGGPPFKEKLRVVERAACSE
jgi:hypothetical protein